MPKKKRDIEKAISKLPKLVIREEKYRQEEHVLLDKLRFFFNDPFMIDSLKEGQAVIVSQESNQQYLVLLESALGLSTNDKWYESDRKITVYKLEKLVSIECDYDEKGKMM